MIKDERLKELAQERGTAFKDNATIAGMVIPGFLSYALGSIIPIAPSTQYFIINFNDKGLTLVTLNNVTGKIEKDSLLFISNDQITSINFEKKLLKYNLMIRTTNGNLAFNVSKSIVGASWHKRNLTNLLQMYK